MSLLSRRRLLDADTASLPVVSSDVLVIGSGIAGVTAALHCSRERSVTLITKGRITQANTWYAQGGIAGAVGEADSVEMHVADTLVVGQGLCDEDVVRAVVSEAPEALESLLGFGVRFDMAERGGVALAREGGHSLPRVLHSGDKTGAAIEEALARTLRSWERIPVLEHRFLVDLLTSESGRCEGALALNVDTGQLEVYRASAVVLATGGAGQVYPVTTNPLIATGDGIAAAWRAGADVTDIEFVQFHPTALDHESAPRFLVSEALRGEGAYLLDCDEKRFMVGEHPLAELAPRDVVSRAIGRVMARCGRTNVWLDARHLGESYLRSRFPNIWHACSEAGYDMSRNLVPVAPAAHYFCGGVRVDIDGRTSVPGLYASGEVSATGLHGANRLASNSLLEGLVFSRRIARALDRDGGTAPAAKPTCAGASGDGSRPVSAQSVADLRDIARRDLGMTRTADDLARAIRELSELGDDLSLGPRTSELEAANLITVASLIAAGSAARTESRGCHYRSDFPQRDDEHLRGRFILNRCAAPRFVAVS